MKTVTNKPPKLLVLSKQTTIQAKISDHNILIKNNILFFNMMMQCRWNSEKKRFNNGFGIVEMDSQYQERIAGIVRILAEAVALNPEIDVLGLAEAPIKLNDIAYFIREVAKYPSLERFKNSIQPQAFTPMGVATFFDEERYVVTQIVGNDQFLSPSLQHRVQEFLLTANSSKNQIRLFNLHLPYDLAKSKESVNLIRFARMLFQLQHQVPVIVIGDFNIDPTIIAKKLNNISFYIQEHNNLLINTDVRGEINGFTLETVDGIIKTSTLERYSNSNYVNVDKLSWFGGNPKKEKRLIKAFLSSALGIFNNHQKPKEQLLCRHKQFALAL
jgi:hypothetical protein